MLVKRHLFALQQQLSLVALSRQQFDGIADACRERGRIAPGESVA
jgi:hypothetical protein